MSLFAQETRENFECGLVVFHHQEPVIRARGDSFRKRNWHGRRKRAVGFKLDGEGGAFATTIAGRRNGPAVKLDNALRYGQPNSSPLEASPHVPSPPLEGKSLV